MTFWLTRYSRTGLAITFFFAITGFACVVCFRDSLFDWPQLLLPLSLFPLLGALAMTVAFTASAIDMFRPRLRQLELRRRRAERSLSGSGPWPSVSSSCMRGRSRRAQREFS